LVVLATYMDGMRRGKCGMFKLAGEPKTAVPHYAPPFLVGVELSLIEERAHTRLLDTLSSNSVNNDFPFDDILISLPLHADVFHTSQIGSEGDKFFVAPFSLKQQGQKCIVYGAGLANRADFENYMSESVGCDVHGFDCTLLAAQPQWNFTFHDTCIGQSHAFDGNSYSMAKRKADLTFEFKGLDTIRTELGHSHIDILKMDIEGFEWDIFVGLLQLQDLDLPQQLLFELHTEGANPTWVPPSLVKGKTRREVVDLFLRLYDRGYRVVYKEVNIGDPRCADFTLLRIPMSVAENLENV